MPAQQIKAVIITAFEPDAGPVPGEFRLWRERELLDRELAFPQGYRPLHLSADGVLGIVTGVGAVRAAASIMALGLDPRFNLAQTYFLISGLAGIDPTRGSLASVVLPEYIVDGNFTHEIDGRELPLHDPAWPDGFIPIGKSTPYEQPRSDRFNDDDGIVFRLKPQLVAWAHNVARETELLDTQGMAERRLHFQPTATAQLSPHVLRGDELSSTTFWHGRLLSQRAWRWVDYQTQGRATYAMTAMEDTGILQSLTFLAHAGRIDIGRVIIARAASNFDQQREGISAAQSLAETKVATYSAYLPSLENAHRVGHRLLASILACWPLPPHE